MRTLVALSLAFVLLLPASNAAPVPSSEEPQRVLSRFLEIAHGLGLPGGMEANATQDVSKPGQILELMPLGDVDRDGADDVLATLQPIDIPDEADAVSGQAQALSGRDLNKVLWNHDLVGGSDEAPVGDVDGDGVEDVAYTDSGGFDYNSLPSLPVPLVYANQYDYTFAIQQEFRSGVDGKKLVGRAGSFAYESTSASAYPVAASVSSSQYKMTADLLVPVGSGAYAAVQATYESQNNFVFPPVSFIYMSGNRDRFAMQPVDGSGSAGQGQATDGDFDDVVAAMPGHFDSKTGFDVLVSINEDPAPYYVYGSAVVTGESAYLQGMAAATRVEAWSSADGGKIWSRTFERQAAYQRDTIALPIGDLDGDGFDEVEYVDVVMPDPLSLEEHFEILSGKDGSTLVSRDLVEDLYLVLPFGDIGGDGKREMLFESYSSSAYKVGVADAELNEIWSMSFGGDDPAYALNGKEPSFEDPVFSFADWTGDGSPDLVLGSEGVYHSSIDPAVQEIEIVVLDGGTGQEAWRQTFKDVWNWGVVTDVSGAGDQDLFLAQAPGLTGDYGEADLDGETVDGRLVAGETGQDHTTFHLRSGEGPTWTSYGARTLGNLDGAGGPEWGIRIMDLPHSPYDYDNDEDNNPTVRWLVFSGVAGAVPQLVQGSLAGDGNGTTDPILDLGLAPDVQSDEDALAQKAREDAQSTPGAWLGLLAVGVLGLALVRRRKV